MEIKETSLFTVKINMASVFTSRQIAIPDNMYNSVASAFYASYENEEVKVKYDSDLAGFNQLVAVRKEYLDTLPSLGENWISGNSSSPSRDVIEKSKNLLDEFNNNLIQKKRLWTKIGIPKLIMGPIPTGGIGVEFQIDSKNAFYINFYNNGTVEIELKRFDYYYDIDPADFIRRIITGYELLASASRNSGWRNTLPVL